MCSVEQQSGEAVITGIVQRGKKDKQLEDNNLFSGTVRIPESTVHKSESVVQLEGKVCNVLAGEFTWLALQ